MNGLINPIKQLFRRKDDPAPSPTEKDPIEPLTIPSEHSNHGPSPFYQDENDDDYFVYKLEPDDNKWSNWEGQAKKYNCGPAFFGLQVSDTIKNSNIHVFPDRQDLVNPSVGRAMKYADNMRGQNYFGGEYYQKDFGNNRYQESKPGNSPSQDENDDNMMKILPTSLLEESQQKESHGHLDDKSKAHKQNRGHRQSSDYQAFSRIVTQGLDISNIEPKKSIDDYSAIMEPKKAQRQNLDESDDMNVALVIKTLENNIAKAKAYKQYNSKAMKNSHSKPALKFQLNPSRKQEDTLSLDQSSGLEQNYYLQEPQDLRTKFLKKDDSNHTVFYSFATTDKHTSGIANVENPYANHPNPFAPGGNLHDRPHTYQTARPGINNFQFNFPTLTRIEEETISGKTLGRQESPSGTGDFPFLSHRASNDAFPLSRNRASEPTIQGFDSKTVRTRNQSSQFAVQKVEKGHMRSGSMGVMVKSRGDYAVPKSQPSENYVLCINCNDLLPSNLVDPHSKFCNESMIASEDLSSEIVLEAQNPQVTQERCNMRLKKIKMLLEKNLKNFKGQVQMGIIEAEDCNNAFSIMELIIKIADEVIRNDKVLSKLSRDITTIDNFKEDLSPFIDIVLASIMTNNITLFTQISRQKEKAVDLVQKKEKEQFSYQSTYDMREDSRNSLGSKFDFDKLRLISLTTPNKVANKPSSYSYKPSTENYGQSTGGSSLTSQRVENRITDWIDATTRNSHKKDYY